ncbi:hypothetical protein ANN_27393 [Periplaneta americana]|uniref:Histone-lysine N-methyltransferase SETMAR n=1 Tax=Periplaneta americana TaxID=6978 RepID=A0ABQ8RVR4_PERAM|nr:hypothetical protein ANN_27393 [Periplaneta americana]
MVLIVTYYKLQLIDFNGHEKLSMPKRTFTPQLARFPVNENTLFQQDGATSHTARISMDAVNALFPGRVISRKRDIAWPPRSPDFTTSCFPEATEPDLPRDFLSGFTPLAFEDPLHRKAAGLSASSPESGLPPPPVPPFRSTATPP